VPYTREELRPYIADLLGRLGLSNWQITLVDEEPRNADFSAQAYLENVNYLTAKIAVASSFLSESAEQVRETSVHELVHVHLAGMYRVLASLQQPVGFLVWNTTVEWWERENEQATEAVARVIAAFMPLPPEPAS